MLVSSAPEPGSTPALRAFEAAFGAPTGARPGPYAALGHAAMAPVLAALDRAAADDGAGQRRRVIDASTSPARPHRARSPGRSRVPASGGGARAAASPRSVRRAGDRGYDSEPH